MNKNIFMRRTTITIIGLIILAAWARFYFFIKSDNFEGSNTMHRVINALNIIDNPNLKANFDGNRSMLYNYLLAAVLHFWPDILIAPRVFSMVFGILIIIPFYLLIKLTFTEIIAFYSCIILSLYPFHAIQSTFSMSDASFYFVFISCLYFIFKFKLKEKKIIWLILSAVLFNIAALLRFESWVFVPMLSFLVFKEGKKYSLLFFCVSLIMPCLWMALCYYFQGDAFFSFTASARIAQIEILLRRGPYSKNILGWLFVLSRTLGQAIVISGLIGIIYSFAKKCFFYLAFFFLYLYLLYTLNTIAGKTWHIERYSVILGLFLIPYSVLFFERLSVFLRLKPVILLLPFMLVTALMFKPIAVRHIQEHTLPAKIKEIAGWLKKNASKSDKVVIGADQCDLYCQDIMVRSEIPFRNFFYVTALMAFHPIIKDDILRYMAIERPVFLILSSKGFLEDLFKFNMEQDEVEDFGYIFKLVYFKEVYMFNYSERVNIYRIFYQGAG